MMPFRRSVTTLIAAIFLFYVCYQLFFSPGATPVLYHTRAPVEIQSDTIAEIDLVDTSHAHAQDPAKHEDRVLILTPLKDAATYLPKFMKVVKALKYPHHLIDMAVLVSDSTDDTVATMAMEADRIQSRKETAFRDIRIFKRNFGSAFHAAGKQNDVEDRHAFTFQGPRRKLLGKARNYLLSAALRHDHAWVLWLDADIVEMPATVIQDLAAHNKDVIVPTIWFHRFHEDGYDVEGGYDFNSWQESEASLKLAQTLDKNVVLAEGYEEYNTERAHLLHMHEDKRFDDITDEDRKKEVELDGIGGVCILVKADVHRMGINFPAYAFENQAETEGFGKMVKRAGLSLVGLPYYVVWHIDTEEKP